ncbi:hypothetical protein PMKS-002615 [Pichia membranifaciens]|uniref:Vacuolar protein sorting-associated protein 29 n=1 Tax=Pichia membranifaciens TaxID=4926 RepID=A0A1Q2YHZ6_9ASCO|nr:hypothetical protein PMKS-002615 [Pichia membranifaciens]
MMDADVLIYGSTHKVEAYTLDGKFFVNPGTGTGAYSTDSLDKEDRMMINKLVADKHARTQEKASAGAEADASAGAVRNGESNDAVGKAGDAAKGAGDAAEGAGDAGDAKEPHEADETQNKKFSNAPTDTKNTADGDNTAEASKPTVSPDLVPPTAIKAAV